MDDKDTSPLKEQTRILFLGVQLPSCFARNTGRSRTW